MTKDKDYWDRLHVRSDRGPALCVPDRPRRSISIIGSGTRRWRGGWLREDRL